MCSKYPPPADLVADEATADPCCKPVGGAPPVQAFSSPEEFTAALRLGMELCTSDFTGWAEITGFDRQALDGPVVFAKRFSDGTPVRVPVSALIDVREGHCVRVDRVAATIDAQGWGIPQGSDHSEQRPLTVP